MEVVWFLEVEKWIVGKCWILAEVSLGSYVIKYSKASNRCDLLQYCSLRVYSFALSEECCELVGALLRFEYNLFSSRNGHNRLQTVKTFLAKAAVCEFSLVAVFTSWSRS